MHDDTPQVQLIPDTPPVFDDKVVLIGTLPDDTDLTGPSPDADLLASLRSWGQLMPLILRELEPDSERYEVIAGNRRIKAMRRLYRETEDHRFLTVRARVFAQDATDTLIYDSLAVAENMARDANPATDIAAIERMIGRGASEAEIAAACRIPRQTIRRRMRLLSLSKKWRDLFACGRIGTSAAEELARLTPDDQATLLDEYREAGGSIKVKDIRSVKKRRSQEYIQSFGDALVDMPGSEVFDDTTPEPPTPTPPTPNETVLTNRIKNLDMSKRPRFTVDDITTINGVLDELRRLRGEA